MSTERPADARPSPVTWLGLALVLSPLIARATSASSNLPWWDGDPLTEPATFTGLSPAGSMLVDALIFLGAGVMLFGSRLRPTRTWVLCAAFVVFGTLGIVLHGFLLPGATLGNQRIGLAWASGMAAAVALAHAGRLAAVRAATLGVVIGLIGLLAAKAAVQVFVEHAATVAEFQRIKGTMFSGDDPSALLAYQRRLAQRDATGWFGLSNVLATFAAMSLVAFGSMAVLRLRAMKAEPEASGGRGPLVASLAGAAVALFTLVLCDSKGGYAVALVAAATAALVGCTVHCGTEQQPRWAPRTAARFLPLLAAACALGAVAARGFVGERIGELSLLFRSFYLEAATRIAASHPWIGVGPDGFKAAYLVHKNPISPEEVASPHSVGFDWWACLGVFGLAWICGLVIFLMSAGKSVAIATAMAKPEVHEADRRAAARGAMLCLALGVLASTWLERAAATPEQALARFAGLAAACGLAWCIASIKSQRTLAVVGFAAVTAAITHAQIEMSATWVSSCGLVLGLFGVAAAPFVSTAPSALVSLSRAAGPGLMGVSLLVALFAVAPAARWEAGLREAADEARPLAEITSALSRASSTTDAFERNRLLRESAVSLGSLLNQPPPADGPALQRAVTTLTVRLLPSVARTLTPLRPGAFDYPSTREASRVLFHLAIAQQALGDPRADETYRQGVAIIRGTPAPRSAAALGWLATLHSHWHAATGSPAAQEEAVDTLRQAQAVDPFSLHNAVRLMNLLHAKADPGAAAAARRVIELDNLQRLDKAVRGLPAETRARAEGIAAGASPPPAP